MKYTAQIERAIENAHPMELVDGFWVPVRTDTGVFVPDGAPHDYPITYASRDEIEEPCTILADNLAAMRTIVRECERVTGVSMGPEFVDAIIHHEAEHQELVTQGLGGTALFGLKLMANKEADVMGWTLANVNYGYTTTKVGHALMLMYPNEPSQADRLEAGLLGYQNAAEVAAVAEQYGLTMTPLSLRA